MKQLRIIVSAFALVSYGHAASIAEPPKSSFDTASIKVSRSNKSSYKGRVEAMPDRSIRVSFQNVTLMFCIEQAYSTYAYQMAGPNWMKHTRYDITATLPAGSTPDQVWPALQRLLTERFKVSIRREMKEQPIYALKVAKTGAKLAEAKSQGPGQLKFQPGSRDLEGYRTAGFKSGTVKMDNASVAEFCGSLSRDTSRPVLDATGIDGKFDFELHYDGQNGPSIAAALQQQLGLKMEPGKGPVEMVVVENAVRIPSEQ